MVPHDPAPSVTSFIDSSSTSHAQDSSNSNPKFRLWRALALVAIGKFWDVLYDITCHREIMLKKPQEIGCMGVKGKQVCHIHRISHSRESDSHMGLAWVSLGDTAEKHIAEAAPFY